MKRWRRQRRGISRAAVLWLPERKMHGRICKLSTGIRRAGRGTGTVWRIQDDTAGLGSVDLNRITPMPVWMREEPLSAGTVRRQGGENCWLDWRQANWGTRWNTLKAQASAAAYDGGDTILFYTQDAGVPVLMQHASRLCPDAALLYAWASRDVGMDCGAARYRDGEILAQICPRPASRQAYVLSFDILREPPEAFGLRYDPDAGTYVYEAEQKQKKENGEYGNHFGQDHIGV